MYDLIDQLVEAIKEDDIYKEYVKASALLDNPDVQSLLSYQMSLQDDYYLLKQLSSYMNQDDLKQRLLKVKNEVATHPDIQTYYQCYYRLNDLLDDVTQIIFSDISDEITLTKWKW